MWQTFGLPMFFCGSVPGAALVWLRQTLLCPRLLKFEAFGLRSFSAMEDSLADRGPRGINGRGGGFDGSRIDLLSSAHALGGTANDRSKGRRIKDAMSHATYRALGLSIPSFPDSVGPCRESRRR